MTKKYFPINVSIQGRFIIKEPDIITPSILVGFHGYGENAETQLNMLLNIPGAKNWVCCSIEALHPFYLTKEVIGYNWMTSDTRQLRINENISYVNSVINEILQKFPNTSTLVFHGFSQGAAMAYRAACLGSHKPLGLMVCGGDIPPDIAPPSPPDMSPINPVEISSDTLNTENLKQVFIGRGQKDKFYTEKSFQRDVNHLKSLDIPTTTCEFIGGHKPTEEYFEAAAVFLKGLKNGDN